MADAAGMDADEFRASIVICATSEATIAVHSGGKSGGGGGRWETISTSGERHSLSGFGASGSLGGEKDSDCHSGSGAAVTLVNNGEVVSLLFGVEPLGATAAVDGDSIGASSQASM